MSFFLGVDDDDGADDISSGKRADANSALQISPRNNKIGNILHRECLRRKLNIVSSSLLLIEVSSRRKRKLSQDARLDLACHLSLVFGSIGSVCQQIRELNKINRFLCTVYV